jgi:23S rRNA (uracil1939-C5)-methyltransferase
MPRSHPTHELTLRLNTMTYGGAALGRIEGKAIFVTGGLPGELVRVTIEEDRAHFTRARLLEVIEPSSDRLAPRCPHFGFDTASCGGCHWQHIDYAAQLRFKTIIVREQLQRIGRIPDPPMRDTIPSPAIWQYRNHAQFHVTPQGALGFQAARSHRVVPIDQCLILEPALQAWLHAQREVDHSSEQRLSERTSNLPVSPHFVERAAWRQPPRGASNLQILISNFQFHVSPDSFFQVNTSLIKTLVDQVLAKLELRATDTVLDAYCGVGLFSRFIAPQVTRVIGIESSVSAQADFAINLAGYANVEFHLGRVEQVLPKITAHLDAALFDPPRMGCGPQMIETVVAQQIDRVVLVSCDPATLARDVHLLLDRQYALIEVQPIDLFPHTYHIETIAVLRRTRA